MGLPVIVRANLSEQVYDVLRDMLLDGRFRFGERLLDSKIAEDLSVSRTPIREALLKLERDGLIVSLPGGATKVVAPTEKDIREIFEIRKLLETFALASVFEDLDIDQRLEFCGQLVSKADVIRKAADREFAVLDSEFHDVIIRAANNSRLAKIWDSIQMQVLMFRVRSSKNQSRVEAAKESHYDIISAVRRGQREEAVELLAEHIDFAEQGVLYSLLGIGADDDNK